MEQNQHHHHHEKDAVTSSSSVPATPNTLSILTYNIHSCVGSDGVYSVDRVADVVREANADIVCMQEVEVNDKDKAPQTTRVWSKPHQDDQPAMIAKQAGYQYYNFAPAIRSVADLRSGTEIFSTIDSGQGGMFGVALLSKYPITDLKIVMFAPYRKKTPRNVLACQIEIPSTTDCPDIMSSNGVCKKRIWVLSTHLGMHIRGGEQHQQAQEIRMFVEGLLSPQEKDTKNTVILAGDFNSASWYASIKELRQVLIEANRHNEGTFPAVGWFLQRRGALKLDYIFHSPDVICTDTKVQLQGAVASDHLAFCASLLI